MKKDVFNIVKIVLSVITFPLWFIKMFVEYALLENQAGEIVKITYRYSMYKNVCEGAHFVYAYISMFIMAVSIVFSIIKIFIKNRKLKLISNIIFGIAITLFIVMLIYASTIDRYY